MLRDGPGIATKSEYGRISEIWQECFGDSEEYVSTFFRWFEADFIPMVYRKDGTVVSAFFALPCTFNYMGNISDAYYLYAGCTDPKFRGNGYFGKLVRLAERLAAEKNIGTVFLVPGEDSLYSYYSEFGYLPCMTKRIYSMTREEFSCAELTERKTVPEFIWNDKFLKYAAEENRDGISVFGKNCRAYISMTDNTCVVYECSFEDFSELKQIVLETSDADYIELYTDSGVTLTGGQFRTIRKGMVKMTDADEETVSMKYMNAYAGHTFE